MSLGIVGDIMKDLSIKILSIGGVSRKAIYNDKEIQIRKS